MVIHRTSNRPQFPVPHHTKKGLSWKTAGKVIGRVLLALLLILLLLAVFGTAAHAAGLVDDTVDDDFGAVSIPISVERFYLFSLECCSSVRQLYYS